MSVILLTAILATGVSLAAVAVTDHVRAAFLGLVLPSGLWIGQVSTQEGRQRTAARLQPLTSCLTFPLRQLYGRMGDDLQEWCDARLDAASKTPQRVADATQYYHNQVGARLRNKQARDQLKRWRESIEHKTSIVRLIGLDTTPARLNAALQWHPSTRDSGRYTAHDLMYLADRLESEAQNELYLFLACVYRLGFHKLLIYPLPAAYTRARQAPPARRPQRDGGLTAWPGRGMARDGPHPGAGTIADDPADSGADRARSRVSRRVNGHLPLITNA
jgi:hypothetical protein